MFGRNKNKTFMKTQLTQATHGLVKSFGFLALCMILGLLANPMYGQNTEKTVTGVVTSLDGPVHGASVVLKGTASGVHTNDSGEFTFPAILKENDVLVVSYLGYETAEIIIGSDTSFIQPFLNDIPVVIIAALRTKDALALPNNKN